MASHHGGNGGAGPRARNARAPVVPVMPLPFTQRRPQNSVNKTPPEPAALPATSSAIDSTATTAVVPGKPSEPSPSTSTTETSIYSKKEDLSPAVAAAAESASGNAPVDTAPHQPAEVTARDDVSDNMPHQGSAVFEPARNALRPANSPSHTIRPSAPSFAVPPGAPFAFPPAPEQSAHMPGPPGFPANPHHTFHPAHSRDPSLVFGGFQNSNSTSPAPPHSGGLMPPPGLAGSMPYMPFPPNQGDWGRNLAPFPNSMNGFPPLTPGFDPSSPHSFHGSQSSAHTDENGYTLNPGTNGQNGWAGPNMEVAHSLDSRPMVPPGLNGVEPGHLEVVMMQLQRSYGDGEYADCEIHITFLPTLNKARGIAHSAPRVDQFSFPFLGHRAVLAQSPAFQELFRRQSPFRNRMVAQYNLKFADPYLTSYSVQMALRSMYGLPLPDIVIPEAKTHRGKPLDKGLALITAGNLFDLPYISFHGVAQTLRFIDWDNIDQALSFCLDDATNLHVPSRNDGMNIPCAEATFRYGKGFGEHIRELLRGIVTFVGRTFPTNFALDTTVSDSSYGRLHLAPVTAPTASPAIVHGSSRYFGHGPVNGSIDAPRSPSSRDSGMDPRLAQIRFGSLSPGSTDDSAPQESIDAAVESGSHSPSPVPSSEESVNSALSRVLFTVPFDLLKAILEYPELPLWVQPEFRHRVLRDIIAERETRRLRVVEQVRSERVQNWRSIVPRLERDTPLAPGPGGEGDVLGWREAVVAGPNSAQMVREWAPLKPTSKSS